MKYQINKTIPIAFLCTACVLAVYDKEGYSWCVFGAIISAIGFEIEIEKQDKKT